MIDATSYQPRRILIVEDDAGMRKQLAALFARYGDVLAVTSAQDAGEALAALRGEGPAFDVLVLDLMMPYGDARDELAAGDHTELDTGLHVLEFVRTKAPAGVPLLWVAVITARSGLAVARRVEELLAGRGKLYLKPFDTLRFENDVMQTINVRSQVPPELLQDDDEVSQDDVADPTEERL